MNRVLVTILFASALTTSACSTQTTPAPEVKPESTPQTSKSATESATAQLGTAQSGSLQIGQASGTYTIKGEVVELKYAYAGRGVRFGTESIIVLVTDKPIPAEAVADEIKSQPTLSTGQLRGLEYVVDKESMWVRYHHFPNQYQESSSNKLKEYTVEGEVVRGVDENNGDLTDGKYLRSVKFVAAIVK